MHKQTESMVASLHQWKKNDSRIQSSRHISLVLPAALHDQPGISTMSETTMETNVESEILQMEPILQLPEFQHQVAQDYQHVTQHSQTRTHSVYSEEPSFVTMPLATTMATSGSASTSYHTFINSNLEVGATSTAQFHGWQPGNKRKRRCGACKEAGRDGYGCPGENNRARCMYL